MRKESMRVVLFCHSLLSDWNHGNAHFLRGVVHELQRRGHRVEVYEPVDAWSAENLVRDHGETALFRTLRIYPTLQIHRYTLSTLKLAHVAKSADLILVHEWNEPALVKQLGEQRKATPGLRLLFLDTHHRALTAPDEMARYDLSAYDGALVFGEVLRSLYQKNQWARRTWTWHEAADVRVFCPLQRHKTGDVVWIGNWGDDERTLELMDYLLDPAHKLELRARIYGVRYPEAAKRFLKILGIRYGGWLPNFRAPEIFAQHSFTVHIPRRPYVEKLRGIPTIRVFEALACGVPLISAPWEDAEGLFRVGKDFLMAKNPRQMRDYMQWLKEDAAARDALAASGRETILARHTCAHRVDELLGIAEELGVEGAALETVA